jgi:hypothetical protein
MSDPTRVEEQKWSFRCQTRKVSIRLRFITFRLLLALFVASSLCGAQTQIEIRNEEGLKHNPAGVKVVLRTEGDRSTFHLFERIPIELDFTSIEPSAYSIELDEIMNFAGSANSFEVSSNDSVFLTLTQIVGSGAVCCGWNKRYLARQPVTLKRELTDYLRFEKPGTYSIFFVTNRVFRKLGKQDDPAKSELTLTSNILTLNILPDDAEWDSQQLSSILRLLSNPHVKANYLAAVKRAKQLPTETGRDFVMTNIVSHTEFVTAQQSLNALDSDDAICQRVKMIQMESKEDLAQARDFGGGSILPEPLLESTTRADFFEQKMKERAGEPDFGVDYNYAYWWTRFLVQRHHPEVLRPFHDEMERRKNSQDYSSYVSQAELEILANLELLVQSKKGDAQRVTALTIKILKSFTSKTP